MRKLANNISQELGELTDKESILLLLIHVLTTLAQRVGPGGIKGIIAESVLLKHQQLIAHRAGGKTPRLTTADRFLCGFLVLFLHPRRIQKAAVVLKTATLAKFRRALLSRNYHPLFATRKNGKPGPKGPSDDLVRMIVEMKKRNTRFGCPRIAQQINKAFGLNIDKDVVRRVLVKHYRPKPSDGGPSWLTFFRHTVEKPSEHFAFPAQLHASTHRFEPDRHWPAHTPDYRLWHCRLSF